MQHKNLKATHKTIDGNAVFRTVETPPGSETFHWIGKCDGDWNNPKNWREGRPPTDGATIVDASNPGFEELGITRAPNGG